MKRSSRIDDFHRHEVLHGTAMVQRVFEEFIAEHGYTKSDPKLAEAADSIAMALADFYQAVGAKIDEP